MRKYIAFLTPFLIAFTTTAQSLNDPINTDAEQPPYFKGCNNLPNGSEKKRDCSNQSLSEYIALKIAALAEGTPQKEGTVYISFVIDETGKVTTPKALKGISKEQDEAALNVIQSMPDWDPAMNAGKPVKIKLSIPIRFEAKREWQINNAYQLAWGALKGKTIDKEAILKNLDISIIVRDENGNLMEINELLFERERSGKYADAHSSGVLNADMKKIVKKLQPGDNFTITATVQKSGNFYYVEKNYVIN